MYREDYEDDVIQNQGIKPTTGYNDNYNNQYQTPYNYNYQEDYFNEEDEYKYLEEEREEAENLEHQRQQQGNDPHQYQSDMSIGGGYGHHQQHQQQQQQQQLDKLDELEEHEGLDDSLMSNKHDHDLDEMGGAYQSDEDATLDDNKFKNQMPLNKQNSNKKRHLQTQESISDSEFFSQRFDGPGLKNLNKQESIIEEEETTYPVVEPKIIPPRLPSTTREVSQRA